MNCLKLMQCGDFDVLFVTLTIKKYVTARDQYSHNKIRARVPKPDGNDQAFII